MSPSRLEDQTGTGHGGDSEPPVRRRWATRAVTALLLVLAVVLPLLRQRGAPSWDTIWAEDGWIYFQQAHDHGISVLFRGYAGYLQLPPRLLAAIAGLVPIDHLAAYLAVSAAVVGAGLAWFVYWASSAWVDSRPARVALASLVVLMPALGYENTATITNLIWIFAAVTPWALVSTAQGRWAVVARSSVVLLSATATLLSVIFVPFAIGWALVRRNRSTWTVTAAYFAGLGLQVAVTLRTHDDRGLVAIREAAKLPEIIAVKVFGQFLLGDRGIIALWGHRTLLAIAAPIAVLGIAAITVRGLDRTKQMLTLAFLASAVLSYVLPAWGRGTTAVAVAVPSQTFLGPMANAGQYDGGPARFSVAPVLLLASGLAIALGVRPAPPSEAGAGLAKWLRHLRRRRHHLGVLGRQPPICGTPVVPQRDPGTRRAVRHRGARHHRVGAPAAEVLQPTGAAPMSGAGPVKVTP